MPTVQTFAVRETDVSRHNGEPRVPPLCREALVSRTANVGTVGMNGLSTYPTTSSSSPHVATNFYRRPNDRNIIEVPN